MSRFSPGKWSSHLSITAWALTAAAGCGSYQHPNVHGKMSKGSAEAVFARASFDFKCAVAEIQLTRLQGEQIGAEGCEQRGVYVKTPWGWMLDSAAIDRAAQAPR